MYPGRYKYHRFPSLIRSKSPHYLEFGEQPLNGSLPFECEILIARNRQQFDPPFLESLCEQFPAEVYLLIFLKLSLHLQQICLAVLVSEGLAQGEKGFDGWAAAASGV